MGMSRGIKKHNKRLITVKKYKVSKTKGIFIIKQNSGPVKYKYAIPIGIVIKKFINCFENFYEIKLAIKNKLIYINQLICKNIKFPLTLMDIISIPSTKNYFREIKKFDSIIIRIKDNKIVSAIPLKVGNLCIIIEGKYIGKIASILETKTLYNSIILIKLEKLNGDKIIIPRNFIFVIGTFKIPFIPVNEFTN